MCGLCGAQSGKVLPVPARSSLLKRPDGRCRRLGLSRSAELSFGTIENGSAASDLPPEGSKKKSWDDLTHLAHSAKTKPRDYQKWIRGVRFAPRGSELRTQNSELRTQNSELRTQNSELRTQNSGLRTQNSGLRTQNSGLRTQNSEVRSQTCKVFYVGRLLCNV